MMAVMSGDIKTQYDSIARCKEDIRIQRDEIDNLGAKAIKNEKKIDKVKENLQDEMARVKDEIELKISDVENYQTSQFDKQAHTIDNIQLLHANEVKSMKEEFGKSLSKEIADLTTFVNTSSSRIAEERLNLAEKYDGKLNKIKDICAQYFSKYEKHLMNYTDLIKTLEKRQDEWV